ncbi:group 1 truncated hemoglobin [Haladaptatus pallidirubidus]|uniref:Group 1 truncated hemoglobin GlbN n=1 Tax=Haladaptatus pallidirubidus TaxID=1008152 RepID=A0AAV3UK49_9EURY|nr:group 1 truncated hemoglobin [Haladaptatus pallidirubidus]
MAQTIYREIGGQDAVEAVIDDFYDRVLADEQLRPYFDGMDMNELYTHQVQFISAVAGGPTEYAGDNMREAHAHLDIDEDHFDAVGRYLETALRENGVGDDNVEAIMAEVVALKEPILGR